MRRALPLAARQRRGSGTSSQQPHIATARLLTDAAHPPGSPSPYTAVMTVAVQQKKSCTVVVGVLQQRSQSGPRASAMSGCDEAVNGPEEDAEKPPAVPIERMKPDPFFRWPHPLLHCHPISGHRRRLRAGPQQCRPCPPSSALTSAPQQRHARDILAMDRGQEWRAAVQQGEARSFSWTQMDMRNCQVIEYMALHSPPPCRTSCRCHRSSSTTSCG